MRNGHSVLDLAGHQSECLFDVLAVLGRGLKEAYVEVFSEFLSLFEGDGALVLQVALVADQDSRDVVGSVLLNLAHPCLHCREALTVGDVVGHDDAVGTFVVAGRDGLEALLTCRVPDLQLDSFAVDVDGPNLEVHTNGGHKVFSKNVIL